MNYHIAARMDRMAPSGIRKVNEKLWPWSGQARKSSISKLAVPTLILPSISRRLLISHCGGQGPLHLQLRPDGTASGHRRQAPAGKPRRLQGLRGAGHRGPFRGGVCRTGRLLDEGDELLVPDPVWLNYINVPNLLGAKAVTYSLKEENGYQMDLDEVRAKITSKTRGIVIVTPNQSHRRRTGGRRAQGAGRDR